MVKKIITTCLISIIVFTTLCVTGTGYAKHFDTYQSYYYTRAGEPVEIDAPFVCTQVITHINGERLRNPRDIFIHEGFIYIADTGNHRILKLDYDFTLVMQIHSFQVEGEEEPDSLNSPHGIFVADDGHIYVADTDNGRIVVFDEQGEFIQSIIPYGLDFDRDQQPFLPTSLVIDKTGRLLVNSRQIYQGVVTMGMSGQFMGYFGANRVTVNPLEYFWKSIATREQRAGMVLDIPTEIAKIHLDGDGFAYVISNAFAKAMSPSEVEQQFPIRRLNLTGDNILNRSDSEYYPIGDIRYSIDVANNRGASNLVDICTTDYGIYFVLDSSKGRIFAYNSTGRNIFTFSDRSGLQQGTLRIPSALAMSGDRLLVLDRHYGTINVFEPTRFGSLILGALHMHHEAEYDEAARLWSKIIDGYGYYDLAYLGIGKVLFYQHEYEQALEAFEIARDRDYYSSAFKHVRKNWVEQNFVWLLLMIVAGIVLLKYIVPLIKKVLGPTIRKMPFYDEFANLLYCSIHPFKGFYDIKMEEKGHLFPSTVIYILFAISMHAERTAGAFLFRADNLANENLLRNMGTVLLVIGLWMAVLFLMQIFLEGEAKMAHIYHATAVALIPITVAHFAAIIVSYVASLDDAALINTIMAIGWIWAGLLVFIGILVLNDYTLRRTLIAAMVNVAGMTVVFLLSVLFFSLISDIVIFISFTIREFKGVFGL